MLAQASLLDRRRHATALLGISYSTPHAAMSGREAHAQVVAVEELRALLLLLARLAVLVRGRLAALVALLPLLLEAVGLEAPPALLALRRPAVHQVEVVLLR